MSTFTDKNEKPWYIEYNVGLIFKIKKETGVDLMEIAVPHSGTMEKLAAEPITFCEVLYLSVADSTKGTKGELDADEFLASLDGNTLESAVFAVLEAMIDFFPPGRRAVLEKTVQLGREVNLKMLKKIEAKLETVTLDQVEEEVSRQLKTVGT